VPGNLPQRLRRIHSLLEPLGAASQGTHPEVAALAREAIERLEHDLLPRTAGASEYLVVGVVGPNNAGKSALFDAMVGRPLSPSVPTGGATRRLVGALHPSLLERLSSEPTLARLALRRVHDAGEEVREALEQSAVPGELLAVPLASLPENVLLIDTPDFDSILTENRAASEALLRVVDLAVVVVTRHTYQNKEVVDFLREWLAHGRPWLCVYNESLGDAVTRDHAQKLGSDLDCEPVALFQAPFDLAIQRGERALDPTGLAGDGVVPGVTLSHWLYSLGSAVEIKRAALAASLEKLRELLGRLAREISRAREEALEVEERARAHAQVLGAAVASEAMPMGPFLEAFRAVLDRRPTMVQRGLRSLLKKTRLGLERLIAKLPLSRRRATKESPRSPLVEIESQVLCGRWPAYYEDQVLDLVPAGRFWRERAAPDAALAHALEADLAPGASDGARDRACAALAKDPAVLRAFQEACEELIERELDTRGGKWLFQIAVDVLHLSPVVAAGIVMIWSGGIGTVVVAGAGTLSTLMAEKISKLLGWRVARSARERWQRLRSERLAEIASSATLPGSLAILRARRDEGERIGAALRTEQEALEWDSTASATT
jgi:hypothetical protein